MECRSSKSGWFLNLGVSNGFASSQQEFKFDANLVRLLVRTIRVTVIHWQLLLFSQT